MKYSRVVDVPNGNLTVLTAGGEKDLGFVSPRKMDAIHRIGVEFQSAQRLLLVLPLEREQPHCIVPTSDGGEVGTANSATQRQE